MLRLNALPDAARTPRRWPLSCGRTLVLPLGVALSGLLVATTAVAQPAPPRQSPAASPAQPGVAPRQPGAAAAPPAAAPPAAAPPAAAPPAAAPPAAAPPAAAPQPGSAPPAPPGAATPQPAPPTPAGPPPGAAPPYPAAPYPAPPQQVPQPAPGAAPGYPPPGYPPPGYPPPGYPPPGYQGGYAPYDGAYPQVPPGYPLNPEDIPPAPTPVPLRRKSPSMMLGGIALTAGGTIAFFAGTGLLASASERYEIYCDFGGYTGICDTRTDGPRQLAGALVSIGGGVMLAVGIPLWIIGGKKVPATSESPEEPAQTTFSLGPGSASLQTRF
ncbi:hypothetical protein [Sorangium sp. So ce1078]|uniref:hypothetical protein n=1 Tax=Sorangium sp. So ce1078 TaxID=3133329 RepID=UPI003F6147D8